MAHGCATRRDLEAAAVVFKGDILETETDRRGGPVEVADVQVGTEGEVVSDVTVANRDVAQALVKVVRLEVNSEIVILFGLARRTARKSRKYHYFTLKWIRAPI